MHNFIFGIYPYIALSVLLIGTIARYERDPFTWKSSSSQFLRRKQLILGSVLFHVGVLTIFFGHLFGLLTPLWLVEGLGISHQAKQILAVVVGGVAGIAALVGGIILIHRRLTDPRIRATSSTMDIAILGLLLLQLCLGLLTIIVSLQHIDGGEMVKFMLWAQAIFTLDGRAASYVEGAPVLFQLHILLGLTIFVLFPFSRLVHMISAPVRYLWRPGYQVVRSRRQTPLPHRTALVAPKASVSARRAAAKPAE
ncbi:respiratory nitrate reductase subunit gamma [Roseovarius sp. M141]|uniref:respiratory nitrate reductase subunit gamma n=1 Tax=Roseovarius sp. M141 TaxID=2583806 RepID=UPI0020CD5E83|nr:respiratory nitrate reductase subunit gamma [Roseovarius sp. M141]MCQ0093141.1 respiratory nitrate reductase subunit gamma [Roseovarius sp. M141]